MKPNLLAVIKKARSMLSGFVKENRELLIHEEWLIPQFVVDIVQPE